MDSALNEWFAANILVHEGEVMRYLSRVWPSRDDVHDLRQECYVRVYESAMRTRPEQPRAFLYATLRNLMIDRMRRGKVVSIEFMHDLDALENERVGSDPVDRADSWLELRRLRQALAALPARCRAAVWLHKVDGMTYAEVARQQGVSVKTIEKQISQGLRRLADHYLSQQDVAGGASGDAPGGPPAGAGKEYGNG